MTDKIPKCSSKYLNYLFGPISHGLLYTDKKNNKGNAGDLARQITLTVSFVSNRTQKQRFHTIITKCMFWNRCY